MRCPFFQLGSCKVQEKDRIPSSFERDEYCKQEGHKICPVYMMQSTRNEKRIDLLPEIRDKKDINPFS